ncbi:MAG: hypothetical protein AB7D46_09330 [Flavobacteriaceae bacterium]
MKKITTLLSVLIVMSFFPVLGQTQFWSDDFEDTGSPSSGIRTPSNEGAIGFPYSSFLSELPAVKLTRHLVAILDLTAQNFGQPRTMMEYGAEEQNNKLYSAT